MHSLCPVIISFIYGFLFHGCYLCKMPKLDNSALIAEQLAGREQELLLYCSANCVSDWSNWESCTKRCAGGTRTKTRKEQVPEICKHSKLFKKQGCSMSTEMKENCNEGCPYGYPTKDHVCKCDKTRKGVCCEEEMICAYPHEIDYGNIEIPLWPATIGALAIYKCNDGFKLKNSKRWTCTNENNIAVWKDSQGKKQSNSPPSCEAMKCSKPQNGSNIDVYPKAEAIFGDIIRYKCHKGYVLDGPITRTCKSKITTLEGMWSEYEPTCEIVECDDIPPPINGKFDGDYSTKYEDHLKFTCDTNFKIVGSKDLKCLASGKWLGHEPTCEEIKCESPYQPRNGNVQVQRVKNTTKALYDCDDGHKLVGESEINCNDKGYWDTVAPKCQVIDCKTPGIPENGKKLGINYIFESIVDFQCFPGYKLRGADRIKCMADGHWSEQKPICEACPKDTYKKNEICIPCPRGTKTITEASSEIGQCICKEGYAGNPAEQCFQVSCTALQPSDKVIMMDCNVEVNGKCTFTCGDGYMMTEGNLERTCQINGKWDGHDVQCGACQQDQFKESDRICSACPRNSHSPAGSMKEDCTCNQGYEKDPEKEELECKDIDECLPNNGKGPCEMDCENRPGSHKCLCYSIPGYKEDPKDSDKCILTDACTELTSEMAPAHGALTCVKTEEFNSIYCDTYCNTGYNFPTRTNDYETCGPMTDYIWTFQRKDETAVLPPCIEEFYPGIRLENDARFFTDKCSNMDEAEKDLVKEDFLKKIKENVCMKGEMILCDPKEAYIICGKDTRWRRKRSGETVREESMNVNFNISGLELITKPSDCDEEVCKFLKIPPTHCDKLCISAYNRFVQASMMYAEKTLKAVFTDANKVKKLNIEIKNRKFKAEKDSLISSGIKSNCLAGMEWKEDKCLACSPGTFLNKETQQCDECPVNTYSYMDKQEKCLECPLGYYQKKCGQVTCDACPKGYFGKNCNSVCPCAHGICSLDVDKCTCERGWMGRYCDQAISCCKKGSCGHPDVKCINVEPPNSGFECGECPDGYVGDGYTCKMQY